ncbi:MAG TPA: hypothetical protein VE988_01910 [Gemmataceae bacterium]|nr:hypothetical protein [Gemmataceae bacterium]
MSYDLFFRSRTVDQQLLLADFANYFSYRRFFEIQGAQAWYTNQDSGVYFSFDYLSNSPEEEDEAGEGLLPVPFNLNYFRPHPFGLEAEPEVQAFVKHFNLTVSDPQTDGMGEGEYSRSGFLRGWNAGNAFAYRAMLSQDQTQRVLSLPSARIETYWRWNCSRAARQDEIGESAFVPGVFFFDVEGEVRTGAIWGDGIPILLPEVDQVIVPRQRLAPRRWFSHKDDMVVFSWAELETTLEGFPSSSEELACYKLFYDATPPEIENLIREKQPPKEKPKGVPFDQVLDRELISQAKPK